MIPPDVILIIPPENENSMSFFIFFSFFQFMISVTSKNMNKQSIEIDRRIEL
jgi:hypothetical protein